MKSNLHAGQFNLKGKKCVALTCGCCDAINFKEREETKRIAKEIRDIGVSFNGRTTDSESVHRGSNPRTPANYEMRNDDYDGNLFPSSLRDD